MTSQHFQRKSWWRHDLPPSCSWVHLRTFCTPWWHWPIGHVSFFLNRMAEVLVQRISVVFRSFLPLGTFPACWRQANVTSILKTPSSSPVVNFWAIFMTRVFYKVFERLVCSQLVPTSQFAYWKYLGTCDPLLCVSHGILQGAFYSDQVARFVQIDFSIALRESTIREFYTRYVM